MTRHYCPTRIKKRSVTEHQASPIHSLVLGMSKCGIGLAVRLASNGMFQVDDVTPNSPSHACGFFKKGDLITAVDGTNVIGFTMDQFVQAVLGAPGSDITVASALISFVPAVNG